MSPPAAALGKPLHDYSIDWLWLTFRDAHLRQVYLDVQHASCAEGNSNLLMFGIGLVCLASVVGGVAKYGCVFFLVGEYWHRFWHEFAQTPLALLCGGMYWYWLQRRGARRGRLEAEASARPGALWPFRLAQRYLHRFDFNAVFFSFISAAFVLCVCANIARNVQINSQVPCHLHTERLVTEGPVNPSLAGRTSSKAYVNEFVGFVSDELGSDSDCVVEVPVGVMLHEPRFQDMANWFRAVLALVPFIALVVQVPFPVICTIQSCGVGFMMAFVFLHPSRFDESLPGFSPVHSHLRLYAWNLIPWFASLIIVYIGQLQRLRIFAAAHKMLANKGGGGGGM